MNAVANLPSHVVDSFMARAIRNPRRGLIPYLLEGSTDDIRADLEERGRVTLHARNFGRGAAPQASAKTAGSRLEENYFYSSRRFPSLTTNTIAGGALTAGSFGLFNKGLGEDGSGLGFPTGFTLAKAETNLEVGGYLPQGTNFVGAQLGVSFNTDIATGDLAQFLDVASLDFSKAGGQFGLTQGPLKFWPGGTGISGYAITTADGTTTSARNLVLALPPNVGARLLAPVLPEAAQALGQVRMTQIISTGVALAREALPLPRIAGLVPIDDDFFSVVSRDVIPDDRFRALAFHFRTGLTLDERLSRIAAVTGASREAFVHVSEHESSLPSPELGHANIVRAIDQGIAGTHVYVTGNYFGGLALEDCVLRSTAEARRLLNENK